MKNKLVSLPSCLSVLLILCSCVQVTNDLDLDKDLLLDMRLAPDGIDIPVGTLDTIHVDSLLRVDYDDPDALIKVLDCDVLGYRMDGAYNPVRVEIPKFEASFDGPDMPSMKTCFSEDVSEEDSDSVYYSLIESVANVSISDEIDNSILSVSHIGFEEPADVAVTIIFSGVPSKVNSIKIDTMYISFPEYVELEYSGSDSRISFDSVSHMLVVKGTVVRGELASGDMGFDVDGFAVTGLRFSENPVVKRDGKTYIETDDSQVVVEGLVSIHDSGLKLKELNGMEVLPLISIQPMTAGFVDGRFNPELDPVKETMEISLNEDLDFLSEKENHIELDNIRLAINMNSNVPVPVSVALSVSSMDADGAYIARDLVPDCGSFIIPACPDGMENHTVTVLVYNGRDVVTNGNGDTVFVYVSRLAELATRIPDMVEFSFREELEHDRDCRISLNKDYELVGSYELAMPFEFSEFTVCYSDTIDGISREIDDFSEYVGNVDASLSAMVLNTIPLGIDMDMFAIDSLGNVLDGVTIGGLHIPAGTKETCVGKAVKLDVDMTSGSLEKLDGIVFSALCSAPQDGERKSLKRTDFLFVSDIVLSLEGGVDIDFTKEIEK